MKKILITILCALSYQHATLTTTTISLSTLTNPDGTPVVSTCLLVAPVVSQQESIYDATQNISPGKIKDITESALAGVITAGTKIPLYTKSDVPYGWGPLGNQGTALVLGGRPNPTGCYIQGNKVYNGEDVLLGTYYATLVNLVDPLNAEVSLMDAAAAGAVPATDSNKNALWLRITENGGTGNGIMAAGIWEPADAASLGGALTDATADYGYTSFRQASVPDDYFVQVYIKPVAASTTA